MCSTRSRSIGGLRVTAPASAIRASASGTGRRVHPRGFAACVTSDEEVCRLRAGQIAMVLTLSVVSLGTSWQYIGIGLSEISSAGFLYAAASRVPWSSSTENHRSRRRSARHARLLFASEHCPSP